MNRRGPNLDDAAIVEVTRVWVATALRFAAETPLESLSAFTCGLVEFGCEQNGNNI